MSLYVEERGHGGSAMVLLHGFSATGAVWRRTIAEIVAVWPGRIVVFDLPGHGGSERLADYTYSTVVDTLARAIAPSTSLVVVGHSFGGLLSVMLASGRHGVQPDAVVGASIKVAWSPEELEAFTGVAGKPVRWFGTRDEAVERYRKVSGLTVDVTDDPADLDRGVSEVDHRFRLSCDPAAAMGVPDIAGTLAAARCPVLLCRGADDPMVSAAELRAFGVASLDIADAGHNVHVEQPARFARTIVEFVSSNASRSIDD